MNKTKGFLLAAMALAFSCSSNIELELPPGNEAGSSSGEAASSSSVDGSSSSSVAASSSSSSLSESSSGGAPSSSSVETDNEPSSSSDAPSSSSVEPSSGSVEPSSSSALPSSSSVAPSSSSTSVCAYEMTREGQYINIPNEPVVICMNLPSNWKDESNFQREGAHFMCTFGGNGCISGSIGTGASAVNISLGGWHMDVKIPYDWTINGYELLVDLQCDGSSFECRVSW